MKGLKFANYATLAVFMLVLVIALGSAFGYIGAFTVCAHDHTCEQVAEADSDYYASIESLASDVQGSTFRSKLAQLIISTHKTQTSYDGLRTVFPKTDKDPNKSGNIIWFYTGTSVSFSGSFNTGTNREHVWPKNAGKAFTAESGPGSDSHHLRPCNDQLNSTRSSHQFGEVATTTGNIVKESGSTSYDNLCYLSGNYFYPGVGYRGATARILMYMQTRWGDEFSLQFVVGEGGNKNIGDIKTLLKWHYLEPPTEEEKARNEAVYAIQGNRNPFIDHPEYATRIYCYDGNSYNSTLQSVAAQYDTYSGEQAEIETITLDKSTATLAVGGQITLQPSVTPTNAKRDFTWSSDNTSVATVDSTGTVNAIANGTATITCASKSNPGISTSMTVTVKSVTDISVSGSPTKTAYYEGETFNPKGLTVTATYSDNSTAILNNTDCQWLDGTSKNTTLSLGSTSVICKYGTIEKTVSGITVEEGQGGTITITRSNFSASGSYSWCDWTSDNVSGQAFIYPGNTSEIQMNVSKASYYLFNTTAIPGDILSITVKMTDGKSAREFDVRTQSTAYSQVSQYPTTGTSYGEKSATSDGTTWEINSSDRFFTINYTYDDSDSAAAYISEIIIQYGARQTNACSHSYTDVVTPPTCANQGYTTHTCSKCGDTYKDSYVAATGQHTYGEWTVTTQPTQTTAGVKTHTCTVCGKTETQSIPATGSTACEHNYTAVVTPPTCADQGYTTHTCSKCGDSYVDSYVAATGQHTYGEWTITTQPTETTAGVKTHTCTVCGNVETENIPATGCIHNYTAVVTAPTCANQGYTTHTCSKCGDSYKNNYVAATGQHTYGAWTVKTPPTDTTVGVKEHTCSVCGKVESEIIPATGSTACEHNYTDAVTSPTCAEQGYTTHTCTKCGDSYKDSYVVPTGQHTYNDWTVTTQPGQTTAGVKEHTCTVCGKTETQSIPAIGSTACEHNYTAVVTAPTCTEQGYTTHTCSKCGNSYKDSYVQATGHNFGEWTISVFPTNDAEGKKQHTCSNCNYVESVSIDKVSGTCAHVYKETLLSEATCDERGCIEHTCLLCDNSYFEYLPALGHDYGSWTDNGDGTHTHVCLRDESHTETKTCECVDTVVAPTCGEDGYTSHFCPDCGSYTIDTFVKHLGHTYGDWSMTKGATTTENGERVRTCSVCGHTQKEVIPAFGKTECSHSYGEWTIFIQPTKADDGQCIHICSICGHVETKAIPKLSVWLDDFENAIKAIDDAITDEERQIAIEYAQSMYSNLSLEVKESQEGINAYQSLQDKINPPTIEEPSDGLSGGEIAAVVIGSCAGAGLLAVLVFFLIRRRRV